MLQALNARVARAAPAYWLLSFALLLAACSGGNSNRGVNSSLATSSGSSTTGTTVSVTSSTGLGTLNAGETLALTATVTNDSNSAGVTWTLTGSGSLSEVTKTTVTYNAPASLAGSTAPTVVATAVADTTQSAAATLLVNGTPLIDPVPLFPATASSAYAASVSVSGGISPFKWELSSGALPDGMTLAGLTGSYETLSGTPTVAGTYPFQMKVTDTNSRSATVDLTLVVNGAASCLLNGQYAFITSGMVSSVLHVRAASFSVDGNGAINGISDRHQSGANTVGQTWSGTCTNRSANSGELKFTSNADSPNFNYAVNLALNTARLQLTNGGDTTSASGQLYKQNPGDFSLINLAGHFAFGLLGAESSNRRMGLVGELTLNTSGTITTGRMDSNAAAPLTGAAITGTMSLPDGYGRGTLNLSGGGQTFQLAYYIINANKLLLTVSDNSATTPRIIGFMTRRASATFNAASLANSAVLSLWGASGTVQPISVLSVGRVSGASTSTGGFDLLIDSADHEKTVAGVTTTANSYSVESDGRFTLNYTTGTTAHQLTGYLDAGSNGYVVERTGGIGSAGLLEVQMAAPFSDTQPGIFITGTQFPQSASPLMLLPITYLSGGSISASSASGFVSIDSNTGRGTGSFQISGLSGAATALYIVNADKMIALRFGGSSQNGAVEWLVK